MNPRSENRARDDERFEHMPRSFRILYEFAREHGIIASREADRDVQAGKRDQARARAAKR